ncbi:amidase [Actinomadura luteofluorescens]|uniref:amidase n=1 Tax=Actinomadura luteofluorescens TaxID=46163 RepID=UPI003D944111
MEPFSSAVSIAEAVRSRKVSPVEVAEFYLGRIEHYDHELNAFIWHDAERVMDAAETATRAVMSGEDLGPFHGVPLPIKDLTSVSGQPNTMGSLGFPDTPRHGNELVVDRFLEAGCILMGRTNSAEMGTLPDTENARYGPTANPWNLRRSPGGSSGGAAAAVAAGLAPLAHGNDGGGSLRMPASACGLVGLKPSRARVPQLVQSWWEYCSTEGVITRYVQDSAAMLDVMSLPDPHGWFQAPPPARPFADEPGRDPGRLRIGLMVDAPTGLPVDAECVEAATAAASLLDELGHDVRPVSPELLSPEAAQGYVDRVIPGSLYVNPFDDPDRAEPYNRYRWERMKQVSAGEYVRTAALLQTETRRIVAQWRRDFDVLLTPTMACQPPELGVVRADANRDVAVAQPSALLMVSFTLLANITGQPAISLPVHVAPTGLPVGVQLIGAPFDEATLLRLAAALEARTNWPLTVPADFC